MQLTVDTTALGRMQQMLGTYAQVSGKDISEIVAKKGNDLRIKLWKGYWTHRWKTGKSAAKREFKARVSAGRGILVRLKYLTGKVDVPTTDKKGRALSYWQQLVAQELARRQAGVGVLGSGFLSQKWRHNKSGSRLVENKLKSGALAVRIVQTLDSFSIAGFTPGLKKIADKYGILDKAMDAVTRDMGDYTARKMSESFQRMFGGLNT